MSEEKIVRCACYTRKSHENGLELEFNSLDAQRDAVENYIKSQKDNGWELLPTHYDDGGFTGGNMERPALKQLMDDIAQRKIDCVVVYKIDRLSRSLIDFSRIMEIFNQHRVNFVSVTQQFSTVDSAGRMMLNILITFSQYEREIISDRVRDRVAGAKRHGKYCGGAPVLGYDPVDRKLVINPEEAELVKFIFRRYAELGSGKQMAQELNYKGYTTKSWISKKGFVRGGKKWSMSHVYRLLNNPLYAGLVQNNGTLYPGEHDAIIDPQEWHRLQKLLKENSRRSVGKHERGRICKSPFQKILCCGHCGGPIRATYTSKPNGKKYAYYLCMKDHRRAKSICPIKRIPAGDLEKAVLDQLGAIFHTPTMLAEVYFKVKEMEGEERRELNGKVAALEQLLEERKENMDIAGMRKIAEELIPLKKQLREWDGSVATEHDIFIAFENIQTLWEHLFPLEKEELISLLIQKIEIRADGLDIEFKAAGISSLVSELTTMEAV
jgi:site-specific DNA recombinase